MFHVEMGTPALLKKGEGKPTPFYTRKKLIFLPRERIKADPGKLAFVRSGYTIILESKDVWVSDAVKQAVESCLLKMRDLILDMADRATIKSLNDRRMPLTTSQLLLGAVLIMKYRWLLPESCSKTATSLLGRKARKKPDHDRRVAG